MKLVRKAGSPYWWYDFYFAGKRIRGSTGEKSKSAACTIAANTLASLSNGSSIKKRALKVPTLREYAVVDFLPWVQNTNSLKPSTRKYYQYGWRLLENTSLASMPIDHVTEDIIDTTKFHRNEVDRRQNGRAMRGQHLSTTGRKLECSEAYRQQGLRTLKVMLGRAFKDKSLKPLLSERITFSIGKTPGRDKLIDRETEVAIERELSHGETGQTRVRFQAWLVNMIMQDTGMRPSEVFAIRLEDIYWAERRIWIPSGKTERARRFVGMSDRMHLAMSQWCLGNPGPGWLFPSRSKSGHIQSISGSFSAARDRAGLDRRLVPYCARHTFGTYAMAETETCSRSQNLWGMPM